MSDLNVRISGKILDEDMISSLPKVEKLAVVRGANVFVTNIKSRLLSMFPAASQQNSRYSDTVLDAIRFSKIRSAATTVHALGSPAPGSGTFRARFLAGTQERVSKKTKRRYGRIPKSNWFGEGASSAEDQAANIMLAIFDKYIENYQ